MSQDAMTYCGPPPVPDSLLGAWNLDPPLLIALAISLAIGLRLAENRAAFVLGWSGLGVAFVSPLCALTVALFSGRALHHLLILTVIAPLLARGLENRLQRVPAAVSLGLTGAALILWHLPPLYDLAWRSPLAYWLMQALLLVPSVLFWAGLSRLARQDIFAASGLLGGLAGLMGFIGAVLTFAPRSLYPQHGLAGLAFGLDPLRDQQLAGLLMWAPGLLPLGLIGGLMLRRAWGRVQSGEISPDRALR